IDTLVRAGAIKPGAYVEGSLKLPSYDDELTIEFESSATNPRNSWLRLRYAIRDYWSGEQHQIDDKTYLTASRPWFGGQRWWFVCPNENRRVRKLYLPFGGHRFRSRRAPQPPSRIRKPLCGRRNRKIDAQGGGSYTLRDSF